MCACAMHICTSFSMAGRFSFFFALYLALVMPRTPALAQPSVSRRGDNDDEDDDAPRRLHKGM